MATTTAPVVPTNAIDASGLSVITAPLSPADPRAGQIYNPTSFAAAAPVWFHPLKDGRFLMVCNRVWSAATGVSGAQGKYSSFTETLSSWAFVSTSGILSQVPGGLAIPTRTKGITTHTVIGGTSKPQDLLWLLHTTNLGPIAQVWNVAPNSALALGGEEILPSTPTVTFDKGINYDVPFIYVYGTDSGGVLYAARKNYGRIGYNQTRPGRVSSQEGMGWQYYTGTGWSNDIADLAPIQAGVTSLGPVSFASWRTQRILATVDDDHRGVFWTSNAGLPWKQAAEAVDLGVPGDGSYLGTGLMLQNQVGATSDAAASANAAIPYITTKRSSAGGNSLVNAWGVRLVTLVS